MIVEGFTEVGEVIGDTGAAVAHDVRLERADHLRVAVVAAFADEDVASGELERGVEFLQAAFDVFVAVDDEGRDDLDATTDGDGWSGYAIAVAEAAMVGGVADWFAVTALFRHPLGLPIPHTAIIPKRKDQIGASLGEFVQDNFLQPEVVRDRLAAANLAGRIGDWLAVPGNARRVGAQAGTVRESYEGEQPRKMRVPYGFWMGRTEVSVGQFRRFALESKYVTDAEKPGFFKRLFGGR